MKTKQVRQDILNQWESLAMGFPKLGCLKKKMFPPLQPHVSSYQNFIFPPQKCLTF